MLLTLLTLGCQPAHESPSLTDEKMSRILADLFIAEAATNGLSGYPKDSLTHVYYDQVFQIHGISREEYEKNMRLLVLEEAHIEKVVKDAVDLLRTEKDQEQQQEE